MAITGMNHAVLYVRDAERTARFYRDVLDFRVAFDAPIPGTVFLQAPGSDNDHDLALFGVGDDAGASTAGRGTVGLYHLAWQTATLSDLRDYARRLAEAGALTGASDHGTTKALYAKDPDGLEFEVSWLVPAELIDESALEGRKTIRPLDLDADAQRYGLETVGGP